MRHPFLKLFALFVVARLGYIGYNDKFKPWLSGMLGNTPAQLSSAGHELLAALQRTEEWELNDATSIRYKPEASLMIYTRNTAEGARTGRTTACVYINGKSAEFYTPDDLKEIDARATVILRSLHDLRVHRDQRVIREILKTSLTKHRVCMPPPDEEEKK